jgi:hypothetical protein
MLKYNITKGIYSCQKYLHSSDRLAQIFYSYMMVKFIEYFTSFKHCY